VGKSAVLDVKILVDAAKAASELDQVGDKAEGLGSKLKGIGGAVAAAGIVAFAAKAVEAASDLEQAVGGTEAVFGDSAKTVHEWAADTDDAIRLSTTSFEKLATKIGGTLKNAGVPLEDLAGKTKETMQLGADMAARWGTSTEDAVDAISAALSRGEFDPLEKYNVSLSAAAVETEKLKLKTGDMAGASDAMLTAQARLNLIMGQSKDALGAAASESDTYAAAQENLAIGFDNFLAAVGAPLLGALGGIFNALADIFPLVEPLAVAVSGLVGWVLQLPTPLLAAAAALVAWQVIGGLSGIIAAVTTAVKALTVALKGLQASTIVGAALLAVMAAIEFFDSSMADAEAQIQQTNDTYKKWLSTLQDGAVTENTRETIALDSSMSGLFDTYENLGISTQAYLDASTGVAGGQEALRLSTQKATNALFQQDGVFGDIAKSAALAGINQDDMIQAASSGDWGAVTAKMQAYADEQSRLTGNTQTGTDMMNTFTAALAAGKDPATAVATATDLAAQTAEKFGVSAADADQAARALAGGQETAAEKSARLADELKKAQDLAANTGGALFLEGIKRSTEDASRALEIFNGWLDQTTQKTEISDSATLAWGDSMRKTHTDLQTALKGTETEAAVSGDAIASWDIKTLAASESGSALAQTLLDQADTYGQVTTAAFEAAGGAANVDAATKAAADAMNGARAEFVGMAQDAGLSETQANALATSLGILDATQIDPKVFSVIAEDEQARSQVAALQAQGIDPKSFTVHAETDPATGEVKQVLAYVDKSGATVTVNANPTPAEGTTDQFTGEKRETTPVSIIGNSAPARNAFEAFKSDYAAMTVTAALKADTGPAQRSIDAVTNASYTATIRVVADTSAFTAAFNALPSSKGVSRAMAAPAVPGLMRAGVAAPQAMSASATGTVTVNVTGYVGNEDELARRIQRVIVARDRRTGGITVGGMRARVGQPL